MKPIHSSHPRCSRRQFLAHSAAAVAAFHFVPGSVLGLNGSTAANERLNIAGIGIGGQGGSDLRQMDSENIVALCDVDAAYAAGTIKRYPKAKVFQDYRQMLGVSRRTSRTSRSLIARTGAGWVSSCSV
jgi:hypothetical protein